MAPMNRIKVIIDGVVYELSSSESAEYIQAVANYIDRKIKSIYAVKSEGAINPSLRTLFVSLNIADDLFKEKDRVKELERESSALKKELDGVRKELENAKLDIEKRIMEEDLRRENKLTPIGSKPQNNNNNNKPNNNKQPHNKPNQNKPVNNTPVNNNPVISEIIDDKPIG